MTKNYIYDSLERLEMIADSQGGYKKYTYHPFVSARQLRSSSISNINPGRVKTVTIKVKDNVLQTTSFEYDIMGNVSKIQQPAHAQPALREYDQRGNIYKETAPDGLWTRYQWDLLS